MTNTQIPIKNRQLALFISTYILLWILSMSDVDLIQFIWLKNSSNWWVKSGRVRTMWVGVQNPWLCLDKNRQTELNLYLQTKRVWKDDSFALYTPLTWFHAIGCLSYTCKYRSKFWRVFWLSTVTAKWKKHKYISVSQCNSMNWRRGSFFRFLFLSFPIISQFVFGFLWTNTCFIVIHRLQGWA